MKRVETGGRVAVNRMDLVQVAFFDPRGPGCVLFRDSATHRGSLSPHSLELPFFYPSGENRRNGLRPIDDLGDLGSTLTLGRIVRLKLDDDMPTLTRTTVIATPANEDLLRLLADARKYTYFTLEVVLSKPESLVDPDLAQVLNYGKTKMRALNLEEPDEDPVVIRKYPSQRELESWMKAHGNGKV